MPLGSYTIGGGRDVHYEASREALPPAKRTRAS